MSELTIIKNLVEVTSILIGKGYSYLLTPSFEGINIKELKTNFYKKMQLVCNFITKNSSEIQLTDTTDNNAVKVEKRRLTWANVVKIGANNIVLIYISDKKSDGKTNAGTYTLYQTHHSYNKDTSEEMVYDLPEKPSPTNINALVSNKTPVLFNKLQIINNSVISNTDAFAGHGRGSGGGGGNLTPIIHDGFEYDRPRDRGGLPLKNENEEKTYQEQLLSVGSRRNDLVMSRSGGGGGGGGGRGDEQDAQYFGYQTDGPKILGRPIESYFHGGNKRRKSRQKKRKNQRNTKRRKSRSRRHHQ